MGCCCLLFVAPFLLELQQPLSLQLPCLSSCPSPICPPCCSLRDLRKMKVERCCPPKKCFSLRLPGIPMLSRHSRPCVVWAFPAPFTSWGATVPLPTQHTGLLSISITRHPPFLPWSFCQDLGWPSFILHDQLLEGCWRGLPQSPPHVNNSSPPTLTLITMFTSSLAVITAKYSFNSFVFLFVYYLNEAVSSSRTGPVSTMTAPPWFGTVLVPS